MESPQKRSPIHSPPPYRIQRRGAPFQKLWGIESTNLGSI